MSTSQILFLKKILDHDFQLKMGWKHAALTTRSWNPNKTITVKRFILGINPQGQSSGQGEKLWRLENQNSGSAVTSKLSHKQGHRVAKGGSILNHGLEIQETNFYHPNPQKAQMLHQVSQEVGVKIGLQIARRVDVVSEGEPRFAK